MDEFVICMESNTTTVLTFSKLTITKTVSHCSLFYLFQMRIIKLAKQWPVLNKLLRIIGRTLGKLSHLTLVFLLVLYIFAVVGMQLLHEKYHDKYKVKKTINLFRCYVKIKIFFNALKLHQDNLPRWNFINFPHAFMVVFRIQCGEWVENMFTCLTFDDSGYCIPLFIFVYVIGNLVVSLFAFSN